MKKIGLILPSFTVEYSQSLLNGVFDFFNGKDVKLIIAQTKLPHDNAGLFDYQYWTSVELLKAQDIDSIIIVTGLYTAGISQEEMIEIAKSFGNKPLISISIDLGLSNSSSVLSNSKKAFVDVVKHLKEVHHCERIAFMSANDNASEEAHERFKSFKEALKANGLEYLPQYTFEGNFTDFDAYNDFSSKIKSKKDIGFDAIVSANDGMCVGCLKALNELGAKVPGEVKIVGFDDAIVASITKPRLSTINQDIYGLGYKAAQAAYDKTNGKQLPDVIQANLFPKFRQSCGCVDIKNTDEVYINTRGTLCLDELQSKNRIFQYYNEMEEKNNIVTLIDMVKATYTLRQFFYNLCFIVGQINLDDMAISLFNEPVYVDKDKIIELPETTEMYMYSNGYQKINKFRPGINFNPRKQLCAHEEINNEPGVYILQPIFSGEINYGFLLCKIKESIFPTYNVYLKIVVTAISQAVEYTRTLNHNLILETQNISLKEDNSSLNLQSKTDDLTGILNRRGFMEYGQRTLDIAQEMNSAGMIFFGDMDNLKGINDTYGHKMGDLAIQTQAQVLKKVFRTTDVVGRLSGDEFGIVAAGMLEEQVPKMVKKVEAMNKKMSKQLNLPFTLSITLGAVDLANSSVLSQLLNDADKALYDEKHRKRKRNAAKAKAAAKK